jgi:HTH-type transcriptional repressor of NAD biosynthesis genes
MTAMPPTKGHLHLIQFARAVCDKVKVIVCTQPGEPFTQERWEAINSAVGPFAAVEHLHQTVPQEPGQHDGFWEFWADVLESYGIEAGDVIVASEPYGLELANAIPGVTFLPYDVERSIYGGKATLVREDPLQHFDMVLPEFQPHLRHRVTVFGAESTGKSTLSRQLATSMNGHHLFEWARPYMERFEPLVTAPVLETIWRGQKALQHHASGLIDKPFIIQDTDLFSTVGYWDQWDHNVPPALALDARAGASDLYLITRSNIPFEPDPLRFGGDQRETTDEYWIELCRNFGLTFKVLESSSVADRVTEASDHIREHYAATIHIGYDRETQTSTTEKPAR